MKKIIKLVLSMAIACVMLPLTVEAALPTIRLEGNTGYYIDYGYEGQADAIRISNVSEVVEKDVVYSIATSCAVVYGETTLTLLQPGMLSVADWRGHYEVDYPGALPKANHVVMEQSERNIGCTITLREPGTYVIPYAVGGDFTEFLVEVRPAQMAASKTPEATYATFLRQMVSRYGVLPQYSDNIVPEALDGTSTSLKGVIYSQLVDFDHNGTQELLLLHYKGYKDTGWTEGIGLVCEVWGIKDGSLQCLYTNDTNDINSGYPFFMAGAGPLGSIGLVQESEKTYLYIKCRISSEYEDYEGHTFYTIVDGVWTLARKIEYDEFTSGGVEAAQTLLVTTLDEKIDLRIGIPDYAAKLTALMASLQDFQ